MDSVDYFKGKGLVFDKKMAKLTDLNPFNFVRFRAPSCAFVR